MKTFQQRRRGRIIASVIGAGAVVVLGAFAYVSFLASKTIYELLGENRELRESIRNLTAEDVIGYAKVLEQGTRDGRLYTRLLFIETDRNDKTHRILEKEYEVEGDVVHFDALIVKFGKEYVMEGSEKALFLWRRIYGEKMTPEEGFTIEEPGMEPRRYADLLARLPIRDRELFWSEIWDLAENPRKLADLGVQAIYGNGLYTRMRPGIIYVFKIDASGTFYPEEIPDV